MKIAILVIAEQNFRDEEYQVPKTVLEAAGIKVITASTTTDWTIGKLGLRVKPDILVQDIHLDKADALVYIGGGGSEQYFTDPLAHDLATQMHSLGKVVGAICIAPVILANAGLLAGKQATVFPDGAQVLKANGANYTGNPVEVDGKIVTGNGPDAAQLFGEKLCFLLS